jgi:hypothetical protein
VGIETETDIRNRVVRGGYRDLCRCIKKICPRRGVRFQQPLISLLGWRKDREARETVVTRRAIR